MTLPFRSFEQNKGFTLIELLIVILLMGMLLSFVTPNFMTFNRREVLKGAATSLVDGIRQTHSLAVGGVQSGSSFVNRYRLLLTPQSGAPSGYYSGYSIQRIDSSGNLIDSAIENESLSCSVCVNSPVSQIDYMVPTGRVVGLTGSSNTLSVCYEGVGRHTITVDSVGKVNGSTFQNTSCTCPVDCN